LKEEVFTASVDSALGRTGKRGRGGYREIAKSRETFTFNALGSEILLVIGVVTVKASSYPNRAQPA